MLVLSRKKNESIVIDDQIVITVVEIRGDKVRLGIQAPRDVPVHRSEVYELLQKNNGAQPTTATPNPVEPHPAS
jgi:carbon storage regulator